jgi:ankyrin repeat protein
MSQTRAFSKAAVATVMSSVSTMPTDEPTPPTVEGTGDSGTGAMFVMPVTPAQKRRQLFSYVGMGIGALILAGFLYTSQKAARQFDFLTAVRYGDAARVKALLDSGASVNAAGIDGRRPLEIAAFHGRGPMVRLLLSRKADPNVALDEAALKGHNHILNLLIAQGGKVDGEKGGLLLCSAAQSADKDTVHVLLRHKASVNVPNPVEDDMTPLMYAARNRTAGVVYELIHSGAKVNAHSHSGQTPLMFAAAWNEPAACKYLLAAGAQINAKDSKGQTPLMLGVLGGNTDAVKFLLASGARASVKDSRGKTALAHAIETNNQKIANLLRKHGGK